MRVHFGKGSHFIFWKVLYFLITSRSNIRSTLFMLAQPHHEKSMRSSITIADNISLEMQSIPSQHSDHAASSPPTTVATSSTTSSNTSRSSSRRSRSSHSSDESTIPARKRKSRLTSPEWSENKSNRNPSQTTRPEPSDTLGSSGVEIGSKRAKTTSRTSNRASWSSPISYKPQQVEEEEEGEEEEEEEYSGDSDDQLSQPSAPAWIPSQPHLEKVRDAKPYKCVFPGCDKAYPKPSRLAEHERVHTDEVRHFLPVIL